METWLAAGTEYASLAIEAMALLLIAFGSVECFVSAVRVLLFEPGPGSTARQVWQRYAHWLVAGLTFQLAADIVGTAVAPTWDDIGRLAAIAAIRTFLNYFLERDIREARESERSRAAEAPVE
jgi:uncharacterized membrane protein